jgi:photosystem II stability/assembly factor-like uncharacterized protein
MSAADVKIDSDTFGGLKARAIGTAVTSGRIAAIAATQGDKLTMYVGAASGGVWKSTNGGQNFTPVFDKDTQSIGAIAIDPSKTDTVWVGTGESWVRNSVSVGTGVYKSTDGGENWQFVGLGDSEHISRIVVDPRDGNKVFVCALGHLWNPNAERGVFRTTDGGKTWKKVLFVNEDTGCGDIAVDPQDSRILYAGMWQARRKPWTFSSGGPGSGLYRSTDGGETWQKKTKGLPEGDLGRIGLAPAPSRPSTVYAIVEAKKTALFRSEDLGETWEEMNSSFNVQGRPFYFANVVVDPRDYKRVYKPGYFLTVSDDGGKTFGSVTVGGGNFGGGGFHGDTHALWIDPKDPNILLLGTDGGVYKSEDRGAKWRQLAGLPLAQFYHVTYDMDTPYNVYGGIQDNGSWMAPSRHDGGIGARHWQVLGGGDGFWVQVDPANQNILYVESQGGGLTRVERSSLKTKQIKPYAGAGEPDLRFNWNAPVYMRASRGGSLYFGAQFLFRSTDRGESWQKLSPDLTTNDPVKLKQEQSGGLTVDNTDAEKHCTIFAVSESPKNSSVIWVGTDDGNVQVTRDDGKTWTNVTANLSGVPAATWVSSVEASNYEEDTAYATFEGHAMGDLKPYVYRTRDFGKTWQALATTDIKGYAHVIREDIVQPNLLFLGTEFGLFISIDGGANWAQFTGNLPNVSVRDIAIHPRNKDLILATHGRGFYILDDITPLRALTPQVLDADVTFLPTSPGVLRVPVQEQRFDGDGDFVGDSAEDGVAINYYLKKRHMIGDLRLEIYDAQGQLVYTVPGDRRRGLNRVVWSLRSKGPKTPAATVLVPDFYSFLGPLAAEGTYTVKMIKGSQTYTSQFQAVGDPNSAISPEDRAAERKAALQVFGMVERLSYLAAAAGDLRDQAADRAGKLPANDPLKKKLEALRESLNALGQRLAASREGGYTGEIELREKVVGLYGAVNSYDGRPTASQLTQIGVLDKELDKASGELDTFSSKDLAALNPQLEKKNLTPLKTLTQDDWKKQIDKKT